ncbi:MAG: aldehyde dehydrogenase family protein [Acidimicrobiia bacterium]|nr:aldehyde dehydrogenase family protein [Acidimicrobiia bacterium]
MTDAITVTAPYDGRTLATLPACNDADIDRAVATAVHLHASGPLPAHERAAILDRASTAIGENAERLARLLSDEAGKPISTARGEVNRAVDTFRFSAAVARTHAGEVVPMDASPAGEGKLGFVMRVPIGVVVGISPFNFPLNLVAHKVAPAIAAGCPIVLKPASATPLTALALADLLRDECGLPDGWLQVLTLKGSATNRLVEHPDVAMVTFTGSPDVGWAIRQRVPRKRVGLELGNNTPVIIEPGADLVRAAAKIAVSGNSYAGQSCISVQRVLVHADVADELIDELVAEVETLVVGDPADDATQVGSLIDQGETERVASWIEEATAAGAEVRTGGSVIDGLVRPTVLTGVSPDMKVCAEEVFGPVLGVSTYTDVDDALAAANDTKYGLQAGIFTPDIDVALRATRALRFGAVLVNEVPTWRADHMPYGGVGDSGNTREGPAYAVEEMTERRLVVIHSDG